MSLLIHDIPRWLCTRGWPTLTFMLTAAGASSALVISKTLPLSSNLTPDNTIGSPVTAASILSLPALSEYFSSVALVMPGSSALKFSSRGSSPSMSTACPSTVNCSSKVNSRFCPFTDTFSGITTTCPPSVWKSAACPFSTSPFRMRGPPAPYLPISLSFMTSGRVGTSWGWKVFVHWTLHSPSPLSRPSTKTMAAP